MENLDLEALWKACTTHNRKAQEQLYTYFSKKLFAVCMRYAHTTLEAEDILQNGFVKIFTKHHLYNNNGSLEGWMKRIMINTAIESFRKNKGSFTESIDQIADPSFVSPIGNHQSDYKDLLDLIQKLPLGYRTIFNLYAIEGYTHQEIAQMLNISEGSSKSQLSRARQWLKAKLANNR